MHDKHASAPMQIVAFDEHAGASRPASAVRLISTTPRRGPGALPRGRAGNAIGGPIPLSVMRAMIAATDALSTHLASSGVASHGAVELSRPGTLLADLVRKYQAASRVFVLNWLRYPQRTTWLVDAVSGQPVDGLTVPVPIWAAFDVDTQALLADDQPLNGLRKRFRRAGLGIPLVVWRRRGPPDDVEIPTLPAPPRPMTAVVTTDAGSARAVRVVRIELLDPAAASTVSVAGAAMPLASDLTAPIAHTFVSEHQPAAPAYGMQDAARRFTVDGFVAITPFAAQRVPLVLLEAVGFSSTTAQIANEVAGDKELNERFQVWLYRYSTAPPFFYTAGRLRADFGRLWERLDRARGRPSAERAVIVAHGSAALLAKTLLVDSGSALWDAVFRRPIDELMLSPPERALLEGLMFWTRSARVGTAIVAGEPQSADALTRSAGTRAAQLLLRQPAAVREAVARIYASQKSHLRAVPVGAEPTMAQSGMELASFAESVLQAVADAAAACERALVSVLSRVSAAELGATNHFAPPGVAPLRGEVPATLIRATGAEAVPSIIESLRSK
jgi:hypothetical protein